ncbi:MAG: hypothetical protein AAFY97_10580, partial [Pseudomonadota bacterium]
MTGWAGAALAVPFPRRDIAARRSGGWRHPLAPFRECLPRRSLNAQALGVSQLAQETIPDIASAFEVPLSRDIRDGLLRELTD